MKSTFPMAAALLLLTLVAVGQTPQPNEVKVAPADVKKLAEALSAVEKASDVAKLEEAREHLKRECDRIEATIKPASLVGLPALWNEVFYAKREIAPSPSGLGRVTERKIGGEHAGKTVEFRYGLILPNRYDTKKRYPLLIALHDKPATRDREVTGPKYLEEVWMKLPKEERDEFIIVAPTMGSGSAGKEFRVEWGDILHIKSIALPLKEMLTTFPIDNDRIYIEGTGEGGEFALHFALCKPQFWAGVAVRSALPRYPQVVPNGRALPVQVHLRAGSPEAAHQGKANLEHLAKTLGLPLEVKEHPAAEKPVKTSFAADVVPEATSAIAAFLKERKREIAPKKLTFVSDSPHYAECYWVRLRTFETDQNYMAKLTATADRSTNTIDVTTEGIESFRLYLNDMLVDLDRPVVITVNGRPHTERQFTRSFATLVKYFEQNPIDPGFQPTATVDVEVPVAIDTRPATDSGPAKQQK